jgi:hypothetical protein
MDFDPLFLNAESRAFRKYKRNSLRVFAQGNGPIHMLKRPIYKLNQACHGYYKLLLDYLLENGSKPQRWILAFS